MTSPDGNKCCINEREEKEKLEKVLENLLDFSCVMFKLISSNADMK
jgi:hypothetical protein